MPAVIDSMMYVGEPPWHREGVSLDNPPSVEEAIVASGLDWTVRKEPTYIKEFKQGHMNFQLTETGHYVTQREDTGQILGNVSGQYEILQNHEAFLPFRPLVDYGYTFETAGAIQNGKKIWILASAPESAFVGDDAIDPYILLYTSHDGSAGNNLRSTLVRVVCQNTLNIALSRKAKFEYNFKHTQSIKSKIGDVANAIESCQGNVANAIDQMNRLNEHAITPVELDTYLETVIPLLKERHKVSVPEMGIRVRNTAKPMYEKIVNNFYNGRGNKGKTLWDAYNAITEYYTHDKQYKDWVKATQFGKAYEYNVNALTVANSMNKAGQYFNGHAMS